MNTKHHWLLGFGSVGCLYDSLQVFDTKQAALDFAGNIANWRGVKSDLHKYGISYDPHPTSLYLIELTSCDCNTPEVHEDI